MLERLSQTSQKLSGPMLVLIAALLWGTDSLYRFPTAASIDPTFIVFCEHWIGILLLAPWIWAKDRKTLFKLSLKDWFLSLVVGAGGGAIATVLFTASFRFLNPSVTILLQKLQPIIVVLLAFVFLGERPERKFYPWAMVALVAGFVLSFPDLDVSFLREPGNIHAKGVIYALSACGLWGITTVAGRSLLSRTTSGVATFWRYFFGLMTLIIILWAAHIDVNVTAILQSNESLMALAYLSVITGLVPMLVYYAGMAKTPASVVTFIELMYPVSAVILNTLVLHTALSPIQLGAGGMLLFAVTMISL